MASAFYSRNNSYSRSYNASCAEDENRLPLTRAAELLKISSAAFKSGCKNAGYISTEWHHVGKYANKVDYYDTIELSNRILFWKGATTKSNKKLCEAAINRIVENSLKNKLQNITPKNVLSIKSHYGYLSGVNFTIQLQKDDDHNLRKAFSMICKKYLAKPLKIEMKELQNDKTPCFVLYQNGYMTTKNGGRVLSFSDVNFDNYFYAGERNGGMFFRHNY